MYNASLTFHTSLFRYHKLVWGLLTIFLCLYMPSVSIAQQPTATISQLSGTILVNGQEQGKGTVLTARDVIETQVGATVVLELSDGSRLELEENTKLDISELSQTMTGVRVSRVKMAWGWLRATLSPDHQQTGSSFDIETPNALVGVKFSQPDIEVGYNPEREETIAFARTVALAVKNLLTGEELLVPVGSTVIISRVGIQVITGIIEELRAFKATPDDTGIYGAKTAGMSTGTKVAIGAGAAAAVGGGVALVAAGSSSSDDSSDNTNGSPSTSVPDIRGVWNGQWVDQGGSTGKGSMNITDQNNGSFSGTVSVINSPCFSFGTISGTIDGRNIAYNFLVDGILTAQCSGTLSEDYTFMSGNHEIIGGVCVGFKGTWNFTKSDN